MCSGMCSDTTNTFHIEVNFSIEDGTAEAIGQVIGQDALRLLDIGYSHLSQLKTVIIGQSHLWFVRSTSVQVTQTDTYTDKQDTDYSLFSSQTFSLARSLVRSSRFSAISTIVVRRSIYRRCVSTFSTGKRSLLVRSLSAYLRRPGVDGPRPFFPRAAEVVFSTLRDGIVLLGGVFQQRELPVAQ
jgi:hypothetical protein